MASSTACAEETCDGALLTALEPGQRLDQPAILLCGSGGRLLRIKPNRSDPECAATLTLPHLTRHQLATWTISARAIVDPECQRPGQLREVQLAGNEAITTASTELIFRGNDETHATLKGIDLNIMSMGIEDLMELEGRNHQACHQTVLTCRTPAVDRQRLEATGAIQLSG
jgi:hypothetical protein